MKTKEKVGHTPGKWAQGVGDYGEAQVYAANAKGLRFVVADCRDFRIPLNEQKANARLIAVAPDLLAALKAMHKRLITEAMQVPDDDDFLNIERASMAAIAKAEGTDNA